MKHTRPIKPLSVFLLFVLTSCSRSKQGGEQKRFNTLLSENWQEVFQDNGNSEWQDHWFLDGKLASIKNTEEGMVFAAGSIKGDDASHAVLWTKKSFEGAIKVEFDYTRLDDIHYAVNILYLQATGIGKGSYKKDISEWSDLRVVPSMSHYFKYMHLLHISYAAYPLTENLTQGDDYVRARRYPVKPEGNFALDTQLPPSYDHSGLFLPKVTYHITCMKKGDDLFFEVKNDTVRTVFYWDTSGFDTVTKGRVGIRHMYTRMARYGNFKISVLE